jgi:hypothetical protein
MDIELLVGLAAAPIIAALLQIIKPFLTDSRWWPLAAIILGVVWNVAANVETGELAWGTTVLVGIITGLAASGVYSGVKTFGPGTT